MTDERQAVADFEKCGAGQGADCCIFLVAGAAGAECARGTGLHTTLVARKPSMTAQREPTGDWPICQSEGRKGDS